MAALIGVVAILLWFVACAGAVWFLVFVWPAPFGTLIAFAMFVTLAATAPLPPRVQKDRVDVTRQDAPELFRLLDQVSEQLDAPKVGLLAFNENVNTQTLRSGFRRTLVIVIGLPLWEALTPPERLALLGHEIAHESSGDLRRGAVIGSSMSVLDRWYEFIDPGTFRESIERGGASLISWSVMVWPRMALGLLIRAQMSLTATSSIEAEFRADIAASRVAGSQAMTALLERTLLGVVIESSMRRAFVNDDDLWDSIRQRFIEIDEIERAAIRQVGIDEAESVDDSHPPTADRLGAIHGSPVAVASIDFDQSWSERVDAELTNVRSTVEASIRKNFGLQVQ